MRHLEAHVAPEPVRRAHQALSPVVSSAFALTMLLLIGVGLAALYEQRETLRAGDQSRQILGMMIQLERIHDALLDAEASQRGYLLTGDASYLEPYERGVGTLTADLARLRGMTADDPEQQERLDALEPLVAERIEELRRIIEVRRRGDEAAALAAVKTNAGKKAMDAIRAQLNALEARESVRLGDMMLLRTAGRDRTLSMIVMVTGGAVLAMLASLLLLLRTGRARVHAEEQNRQAEERLRTVLSQKLADSEGRARAVLETTVSAIISIDAEGRIETFNRAAERMFCYDSAEVIGRNVTVLMPPPYRDEHDGYLRHYLETGEPRVIGIGREVVGLRKDGVTFPMGLAVADTLLEGRHVFTAVIHDLTREKEAAARERTLVKQALQNERLAGVGAMTARVAHDFGNPLAGVRMTAQRIRLLLDRDPLPVDRMKQAVEIIVSTTDRLDGLVKEFKEVAREQRLELGDVALAPFLRQVAAEWQEEARGRAVTLEVEVQEAPTIRADADKLRRVLDNLVKNALEAVDRGPGTIRVAAESHGPDRVRILVSDSGPGIPEGKDVFALFETTKPTGTGMGLAICRQIVQAHGGGIEHAPAVPKGTVFQVELPRHGPTAGL